LYQILKLSPKFCNNKKWWQQGNIENLDRMQGWVRGKYWWYHVFGIFLVIFAEYFEVIMQVLVPY
jgi:hypothetical protein